jgi:hypothetical protein
MVNKALSSFANASRLVVLNVIGGGALTIVVAPPVLDAT